MKKFFWRKSLTFVVAVPLFANAAYGQWKYEAVEDHFADDKINYAYIEDGSSQIGVKCQSGVYELVYVTADRTIDSFTLAAIEAIGGTKLMFRIDKAQPATSTAKLDMLVDRRLRAIGSLSTEDIASILKMKKSIAVQLVAEDRAANQMKFSAEGSTAALKRVITECKTGIAPKISLKETALLSLTLVSILFPPVPHFFPAEKME